MKGILLELTPWLLVALRFGIASLLLGLLAWLKKVEFDRRTVRRGFILGLMLMAAYIFQTTGLVTSGAGKAAFICALYVVLTPLVAAPVVGRRLRPRELVAATIALLGVYFLSDPQGVLETGDLFTLGSAVAFAFHMSLIDRFAEEGKELQLTVVQLAVVGLFSLAAAFIFERPALELSWAGVGRLVYLTLPATAFVIMVQMRWQPKLGAGPAALVYVGESAVAWLGGLLILGERFAWTGYLGAGLIVAAILWVVLPRKVAPAEVGLPPDPGATRRRNE